MFSDWRRWRPSGERHTPDEDLLLYLDNEVSSWRTARIQRHLDLCWSCRVRKEKLQQAIHDYVAVRSQAAATGSENSARMCLEFDRRLAVQEQVPAAGLQRLRFRMPATAWACVAIAAIALSVTQSASARATLGRIFSVVTSWASKPEPLPLRPIFPPIATLPDAATTKAEAYIAAVPVEVAPIPSLIPARTVTLLDIENAKIEILYSLHRSGACLRYPLQVIAATAGGLHVRGVLENAEQEERVIAAGQGREWINFDIRTEAEAIERQRERGVPASPVVAVLEAEVVRGSAPAVQPLLARHFQARFRPEEAGTRIVRFSNESLDRAAALKEHAWALRRLAENFPAGAPHDAIDQTHAWLLEEMITNHMGELRDGISSLRRSLAEVFPAIAEQTVGDENNAEQPLSWQDAVSTTFVTAETIERAMRQCFASTGAATTGAETAAAELVRSFAPAAMRMNSLQAFVERRFDFQSASQRKPAPIVGTEDSLKR